MAILSSAKKAWYKRNLKNMLSYYVVSCFMFSPTSDLYTMFI